MASRFYDVGGFKAGHPQVEPFEVDELGALGGLRLAHLQCHFGLDTLDLVRMHPTLDAVGLDFSGRPSRRPGPLAGEVGLADRARFVHADVHQAADVLGRQRFDVVYTGKGALCWLPDLRPWAEQCAGLLRPGGWLYVCEFHPVGYCLDEDAPVVSGDYFDTGAQSFEERPAVTPTWTRPPSITSATSGPTRCPSYSRHSWASDSQLRFFHEWDHTLFRLNSWLVQGDDGRYRWPGPGRLPLMYSLKAEKDGLGAGPKETGQGRRRA